MIKKIFLADIATYTKPIELNNLKKINYFYGNNGTGKTAISKLINEPEKFPTCNLEWENNDKIKTMVFNENFVTDTFYQKENFPGIFTLGEGAKETEEKIHQKKVEIETLNKEINKLEATLHAQKEDKESNWNNFQEICWNNILQKHQEYFSEIFKGYRNSKKKLADKIITENQNNNSDLKTFEELKDKYNLLFNEELNILDTLDPVSKEIINNFKAIEQNKILKTKIIGKNDIDISNMIHKLGNHDWVRQGRQYYNKNFSKIEGSYICPFCQQKTSEDFKKQLEEYFDKTYENQIQELSNLVKKYTNYEETIEYIFNSLKEITSNKYIDEKRNILDDQHKLLKQKIINNKSILQNKESNPSSEVELQSILNNLDKVNKIIEDINVKIKRHNSIAANKEQEINKLISDIWGYFCNKLDVQIDNYLNNGKELDKAIDNISRKVNENKNKIKIANNDISQFEKQIKSVKPTVEAINALLRNFGFTGFRLSATDEEKHYQIIRDNGESAKDTLSEGERNFIVFLYFYYLIKGVLNPAENITENKVIVFDDPVSSLDSDVLFIVATLIKQIIARVRKSEGNIKQIILLTHNAYFFKEVTFMSSRESQNPRNDTKYFVISKDNNISKIEDHDTNPIKTTYQLLWDEIKKESIDSISLQNAMRRVIEFYFTILANMKEDEILENFEEQNEKIICRSLISWLNVGSHEVFDDINYSVDADIDKYKKVFKKIFEGTGHIAHYNMMMGIN